MIEFNPQPKQRFVVLPAADSPQNFMVYDSLLEQPIGSQTALQNCMDMVIHLNRATPNFE